MQAELRSLAQLEDSRVFMESSSSAGTFPVGGLSLPALDSAALARRPGNS